MLQWKSIKDFENYEVSTTGQVRRNNKVLNPGIGAGYLIVCLSKHGLYKTKRVHRLVAETFLPNPANLPAVNHKDGIKTNNELNNLEWCSHSHNINHAHANNLVGSVNYINIIIATDAAQNISVYKNISEASKSIGVPDGFSNIAKCCKGERPTAYGYSWKYASDLDSLDAMFTIQRVLQTRLCSNFETLDVPATTSFIKENCLHTTIELSEMLMELPFLKGWKKYNLDDAQLEECFTKAKEEFVDVFTFMLNIALALGFNSSELYSAYCYKNKINHERQSNNY